MIRRVSSTRATKLSQTSVSRLRSILHVGDIHPAKIVDGLGEGRYLVEIKGQQVLAESQLNLDHKRHYIQVQELHPKINLRLVSLHDGGTTEQLVQTASRWGIPLNLFNQYVLDRLYRRNPGRKKNPSGLLAFLFDIASLREIGDLVEFDDWIDVFDEMDDTDTRKLLDFLRDCRDAGSTKTVAGNLRQLSEEMIYLFHQIPEKDNALAFVNNLLEKKGKYIYGWEFPGRPVMIEKSVNRERLSTVYQMNYRSKMLDRIRVRLHCLDGERTLALGFTNSIVAGEFGRRIDEIKPLLSDCTMIRTEILTAHIPSYLTDSGSFYL